MGKVGRWKMRQGRDNDHSAWKVLAIALLGVVATGASAWMVFDQGVVGREEVSRMIAEQSPYLADRLIIRQTLEANSEMLKKVAVDINAIKVDQARLGERVEMLMKMKERK